MSVEDLQVHFQYLDDDELASQSGTADDSSWARQYYIPGDLMKGIVSLHVRGTVRVRALTLHLLGTASVSWEAPKKQKVYQSSEVHLDFTQVLMDAGRDNSIPLGPGMHQFSFKYQLDPDLPSTFNGVYGQVTYLAKALLECDDNRDTTLTSEPFLVLRRPDLPDSAYAEVKLKKAKFFWGFTSGKIRVECSIDKAAAVPGDDIIVDAVVTNFTNKYITLIQACVTQESTYLAEGHEIKFRQYISKRDDVFDVGCVHQRSWDKIRLPVPPFLADSGLDQCQIMDVKYSFQFKVSINKRDDIVMTTPLYVGSHSTNKNRDLMVGRMWENLGVGPEEPTSSTMPVFRPRPLSRSAFSRSVNGDYNIDNRFYLNMHQS